MMLVFDSTAATTVNIAIGGIFPSSLQLDGVDVAIPSLMTTGLITVVNHTGKTISVYLHGEVKKSAVQTNQSVAYLLVDGNNVNVTLMSSFFRNNKDMNNDIFWDPYFKSVWIKDPASHTNNKVCIMN